MSRKLTFTAIVLTIAGLIVFGSIFGNFFSLVDAPAQAQQFRPQDVWRQVYQQLPELPLENEYANKENGQPATDNTLVNRLIRYHLYVKGRPPMYRLDWKLTIADYLGAHDLMNESVYPGYDTLRQNPMEGDRAAISRLTRSQRDALINAIVSIFNPNVANQPQPTATPNPSPTPPTRSNPNTPPRLPQPGDARLLMP